MRQVEVSWIDTKVGDRIWLRRGVTGCVIKKGLCGESYVQATTREDTRWYSSGLSHAGEDPYATLISVMASRD